MRKYIFLVFFLCFLVTNSFALGIDTALSAISGDINAAYQKAHDEFVEVEMVKQTLQMIQNYNASVDFYNKVQAIQEHKGGVGGYVHDSLKNSIDTANKKTYWELQQDMQPNNDTGVTKFLNNTDKEIYNSLDYSKEIHDIGVKRDADIKSVSDEAASNDLDQKKYDKLVLRIDVLTLDVLSDMNKSIQQLLISDTRRQKRERDNELSNKADQDRYVDALNNMYDQEKNQNKKNPYTILKEVPK